MVVMKRKTNNEVDTQTNYDNIIDVSDRKSYNAHEKETAEERIYSTRESFVAAPEAEKEVQQRTTARPRGASMHSIQKEPQKESAQRESVSSKTKVLLAAYIIIAIILAAVVIGTGIAITTVGNRASALDIEVGNLTQQIETQSSQLAMASDDAHIAGKAMLDYGMTPVGDDIVKIPTLETVEVTEYAVTTNGFDKFCDWVSKIFG